MQFGNFIPRPNKYFAVTFKSVLREASLAAYPSLTKAEATSKRRVALVGHVHAEHIMFSFFSLLLLSSSSVYEDKTRIRYKPTDVSSPPRKGSVDNSYSRLSWGGSKIKRFDVVCPC